MKKSIVILLCLLIFAISGCSNVSDYNTEVVQNVSASITDVSPTGATLIIKDTNDEPYIYGEWYEIEKSVDGEWCKVETVIDAYGFNDLGYIPGENDIVEFKIDWEWLYGELQAGNYRILKQFDEKYVYAEFTI